MIFETSRVRAKPLLLALTAAGFCAGLTACGGGGSDTRQEAGGADFVAQGQAEQPPAVPVGPNGCPSVNNDSSDLPSLESPQCGSIAAVAQTGEGLYYASSDVPGEQDALFFAAPKGQVLYVDMKNSNYGKGVVGSIASDGRTWTLHPGARASKSGLAVAPHVIDGSGRISPRNSIEGQISEDGKAPESWGPLRYQASNALAVNQDSVTGRWDAGSDYSTFNVGADGALDGIDGPWPGGDGSRCKLKGAVTMAEPGTAKNLYHLTMTVGDVAGDPKPCRGTTGTFTGYGAIVIASDDSGKPIRQLWLAAFSPSGDIYWDYLSKQ